MNLHDEIAVVAYGLYVSRGQAPGRDFDDWLDAERVVLGMHSGQENEEPDEEDFVAASVRGESTLKRGEESGEESYLNEEMS